eukprot:145289-Hanusia_phi.AAC.3
MRWVSTGVALLAILVPSLGGFYFGIVLNQKSEYRTTLASAVSSFRARVPSLAQAYRSHFPIFKTNRRSLHWTDERNSTLAVSLHSTCSCGCCIPGVWSGCYVCCGCPDSPDTGVCSSRRTGHCGCCTPGYLYGCSGSCGGSGTGPCSARATYECGCCQSGIVYGCLGSCGDTVGTGLCSQRASGTCGCCDQGFLWGCRGTCGGTTYTSSALDAEAGKAQLTLASFGAEFGVQSLFLAQIDIIKTSYSLTTTALSNSDFSNELGLQLLKRAVRYIPPPYGTAIRVAWGAYDFVTTYQETGSLWDATRAGVGSIKYEDFKAAGNLLSTAAKSSQILKRSTSVRSIGDGNHTKVKLRTTANEPLRVRISFFVNISDTQQLHKILNDIGEESLFSESAMDPVTYGFWDDTQTLTVGCIFSDCNPQTLIEPSSQISLNVTFTYAAGLSSISSTTSSTIRTVIANVIGPMISEGDISLVGETVVSSSATSMTAVISFKSKLAATKGRAAMTASNLNAEGAHAGLGSNMFSSVSTDIFFANFTTYQLVIPQETTTTTVAPTTTSEPETTPAPGTTPTPETTPAPETTPTPDTTPVQQTGSQSSGSGSIGSDSSSSQSSGSQSSGSQSSGGKVGSTVSEQSSSGQGQSSTPAGSSQVNGTTGRSNSVIIIVAAAVCVVVTSIIAAAVVYVKRKHAAKKVSSSQDEVVAIPASVPDIPTGVVVVSCLDPE